MDRRIKTFLGLLFAIAFVFNSYHRYYHRAELSFHLSFYEWTLLLTGIFIFINQKGIKLLVLLVLVYFIAYSTNDILRFSRSGMPRGLFFAKLALPFRVDSGVMYFAHIALYIVASVSMFIQLKTKNRQLLDQE